ncbi:MAG: Wzz/FepE/Etk N-terminal domain-containing protein, partial [Actinomycetota bacterium]
MDLDLRAYARVLWKRKWMVLAGFLSCLLIGVFLTARAPKVYQAKTTLFVGDRQASLETIGQEIVVRNFSAGLLKSYVEIIQSRSIAQRAITDASLDVTPGQILGGLRAQALLDTQIISLTYQGTDPVRARLIANAVAEAFITDVADVGPQDDAGAPAVEVSVIDEAFAPGSPIS